MRDQNQSQHEEQDIEGTVEESENRVMTEQNQSQREEQYIESKLPLAKIIHVSSRSTNADRRPCGVTTQDLQFGNRYDPTAAGRLCVQHILSICRWTTTRTTPSDKAIRGLRFVRLPDCPSTRSSEDDSEPLGQANLRNITRRLRMRQMFPALQPREGLVPGQVTDPTIGIGIASRRWI